jgi:hypothetical protein
MLVEVTEKTAEKLICESCGAEFSCGAGIGHCWCFSVEVKTEALAEMRDNYTSCLCKDCLINLAKTQN